MKLSIPILALSLWATGSLVAANAQEPPLPPQANPEMTAIFNCREPVTQPAMALAEFLRSHGFNALGPRQLENLPGYSVGGEGDPFVYKTQVVAISNAGRIVKFENIGDAVPANYVLSVFPSSDTSKAAPFDVGLQHQISRSGRCDQAEVHYFPAFKFDAAGYASLKAQVLTAFRVIRQPNTVGLGADARRPLTVHRLIIHTSPGLPKITQRWSGDAVLLDLSREPSNGSATVEPETHQHWPSLIDLIGPLGFLHVTVRGALSADYSGIVPSGFLLHLCPGSAVGIDKCPPGPYRSGSPLTLSWN